MKEFVEAFNPLAVYLLCAWVLGILTWMVIKHQPDTAVHMIGVLNMLNQPWIAICVIVLGMTFDIVCQRYGVSNDAATGVIGAGVGLLTGQALNRNSHDVPPPNPSLPVEPAQPKK